MNILLINYEYPPVGGGAATATRELACAMQRMGHLVTVLTAGYAPLWGESVEAGVTVVRLRSRRERAERSTFAEKASFVMHAACALPGVIRRAKPEGCIVFFSMPCGPLGPLARFLGGIRYVVSLRGGDVPGTEAGLERMHWWLAPVRRWVLRGASAVVANSEGLAALSRKADPVGVTVIANGVDPTAFVPAQSRPAGRYRFLFVGRLDAQKDVATLLEAAARLRRASALPFRLTVVGDGPRSAGLRTQAGALDIEDLVEWKSWMPRPGMPGCYASVDCLVNPSLYEGMPNVVLEAMACALPVIASDVAGNSDVVDHEETGLMVPPGNADALAQAMRRMLEAPDAAAALGRAGRAKAERRYSWAESAGAYLKFFH